MTAPAAAPQRAPASSVPFLYLAGCLPILMSASLLDFSINSQSFSPLELIAPVSILLLSYFVHGFITSIVILLVSVLGILALPEWLTTSGSLLWNGPEWLAFEMLRERISPLSRGFSDLIMIVTILSIPLRLAVGRGLKGHYILPIAAIFLFFSVLIIAMTQILATVILFRQFALLHLLFNILISAGVVGLLYIWYGLILSTALGINYRDISASLHIMNISRIDIQNIIQRRTVIIGIISIFYLYVIISFSGLYFYIDHCDPCSFVHPEPMLTSSSSGKNFNFSPTQPGTGAGAATIPSLLPYLYFSVVTSTTVGYGDIYPVSVTAVWIVIFHHLVSIVLLIGVVGQIAGMPEERRS